MKRKSLFSVNGLVHRIAERYVREAAKGVRGQLLDVGCGDQPYRALFPHVRHYVGLDRSRNLEAFFGPRLSVSHRTDAEYGRDSITPLPLSFSASSASLRCDVFVCGDALRLPFFDEVFDAVLATQVLEHVPEPGLMMQEMARVLKGGRCVIVTAPLMWGVHEEPRDYFRFTGYGLRYLAERAGLEVLFVRAMAGYWVTAGARLCYYLEHFERGVLIPLVRVLYFVIQVVAWGLDRLHRVEGDAWNFVLVARKCSRGAEE